MRGEALGLECSMLTGSTLEKLKFRCYEFKNGDVIDDGVTFEMELAKLRQRIKRGVSLYLPQ